MTKNGGANGRRSRGPWACAWTLVLGAAGAPAAGQGDARAGWLDQRTEVGAEVTASTTAETLFNPGGKVYNSDALNSRLRLRSELTLRLPASIGFKSIAAFQLLNTEGDRPAIDWTLLEAYLHRPFGRAELSAGRKILRWTNGYAFAPAGLLDPARDPSDPQDRLGRLEGRDLVQLDLYAGAHTFSAVYAPGEVLPASAAVQEELLAFRYHVVLRGTDVSLMAARRMDSVNQAAASVSTVVGAALELHAEAVLSRGSSLSLPRSSLAGSEQTLYDPAEFYAPLRLLDRRVYVRWLLGINYTLPGGVNLIAEYFHAAGGLSPEEWERVLGQAQFSRRLYEGNVYPPISDGRSLPELNLLLAQRSLGGGALGRHYGFLRLARAGALTRLDASVLAFANLQDRSLAVVPEASVKVQRRTTVYGRATFPIGGNTSEFGNLPIARTFNLGLRVAF